LVNCVDEKMAQAGSTRARRVGGWHRLDGFNQVQEKGGGVDFP